MKFNAKSKLFAALFPVSKQEQTAELVELNSAELAQVSGGVSLDAEEPAMSTFSVHDNGEPAKDWWVKK